MHNLIIILSFLWSSAYHSFHVSVADLTYDHKSNALEMSCRIFTDDLENAIRQESPSFLIDEADQRIEKPLQRYLEKNLSFYVNGQQKKFDFLGFKREDAVIVVFIEVTGISHLKSLKMKNTILTDLFNDQENLIHFKHQGISEKTKSFRFNAQDHVQMIYKK